MSIEFLQKNKFFRGIIYYFGKTRARETISRIGLFLNKGDSILDIGAGTCNICEDLSKKGFKITPLDIQDLSFVDNIKPVIYDGDSLPHSNNKFDKALILTVLHHVPDPEKILKEAKRVSKGIIIIEDIFSNWFHKQMTYFFDSLFNLEFGGHPHTNKSDDQWRKAFEKLGLKLVEARYCHSFLVFSQAIYYLEK